MKMKEFGPPGGARVPGAPPWIRQCRQTGKVGRTKSKRAKDEGGEGGEGGRGGYRGRGHPGTQTFWWSLPHTSATNQEAAFLVMWRRWKSSQPASLSIDHTHRCPAGARSKNSATNHSTFQKTSELFSIGGGHVVPVVNNTTCFSIYKWLLFLLLFSSYFPLLSHSFLK